MSGLAATLTSVLGILVVALVVRLLVRNHDRVAYASVLVAVGLVVPTLAPALRLDLTADVIFLLLLPAIIFHGTTTLNVRELRHNAPLIGVLTLVGLPVAVGILGVAGTAAFGFDLPIALLFAAVILPTDPAAVLSIFNQLDVAERLAITIEGESLLNDGVAIVIFSSLLASYRAAGESVASLATPAGLVGFAGDVAVVGGGGLLIGVTGGYLAHLLVRRLDETMSILLISLVVAYGSFLVVEHYLHLSGVLATVGAGLAMGAHEETHAHMSDPEETVQEVWSTLSFLVTTVLYVLIGSAVRPTAFIEHWQLVAVAAVLVVVVRAITIYPLVSATNLVTADPIPRHCQHIMVWGGLHTVVPVALVLSLPESVTAGRPLETMVFGVAILSIVIQGLLMPTALDLTGLANSAEGEEPA